MIVDMGHHKKRFGQHFLHDQHVLQQITSAINPQANQRIIEIGPGAGALTKHLLPELTQLTVIELDRDLIPVLKKLEENSSCELSIINRDVLEIDFETLVTTANTPLRIVGNLPYNISTPVIFKCLESSNIIDEMIFLLQKEVVDRLTATPGSKSYGRLSVMTQYHCQTEYLLDVSPAAFTPPPRVNSALVKLKPHNKLLDLLEYKTLQTVVRNAFSQRRKTITNSLKTLISVSEIEALKINPKLRPEQLSVEQFVDLSNHVSTTKNVD